MKNWDLVKEAQFSVDAVTPRTLSYDLNGNLLDDGINTYEWDALDQLVAVNYTGTDLRTEFEYDAFGRRVRIVEKDDGVTQSEKRFVWDGLGIAERRAANGTTVERRYFGEGFTDGSDDYFYVKDHLGSIRAVIDENEVERGRWNFGLYGERSANEVTTNPVEVDFGYTGHYHHAPSGLVLAAFRAYSPELGRWLNRDPIGEAGGINLYGYVLNNPVNLWDPFGWCDDDPILNDPNVQKMIDDIWNQSTPFGRLFAHEHYGFISQNPDGTYNPSSIYKTETRWGGYRGNHKKQDPAGTIAGIRFFGKICG